MIPAHLPLTVSKLVMGTTTDSAVGPVIPAHPARVTTTIEVMMTIARTHRRFTAASSWGSVFVDRRDADLIAPWDLGPMASRSPC